MVFGAVGQHHFFCVRRLVKYRIAAVLRQSCLGIDAVAVFLPIGVKTGVAMLFAFAQTGSYLFHATFLQRS